MSNHRKVWKQCSYVKNDHSRDSQTSLSQSRSNQSFRFSQIKFKKSQIQTEKTSKKFTLANHSRVKEFKNDRSLLQQSNQMKENSIIEAYPKEPTKLAVKTSTNRRLQTKMKAFLQGVKRMHEDMKMFAESLIQGFQKMKNQLQTNLLQVSSEILKLGNVTSQMEKVNQIFHKGFAQIRKTITILPASLTKLSKECEQSIKKSQEAIKLDAQSPLLKFQSVTGGKLPARIVSNFNSIKKEGSQMTSQLNTKPDIELPLMTSEKLKNRSSTQRLQYQRAASFEHEIIPETHRKDSKAQKESISFKKSPSIQGPQFQGMTKIDDIIFQMRIILNQSNA